MTICPMENMYNFFAFFLRSFQLETCIAARSRMGILQTNDMNKECAQTEEDGKQQNWTKTSKLENGIVVSSESGES